MKEEHIKIWKQCLSIISDNLNAQSFSTWFEPIVPSNYKSGVLTIQVPSQFFYEWLEEHYVDLLGKTIKRVIGDGARLEYKIVVDNTTNKPYTVNLPTSNNSHSENPEVELKRENNQGLKSPFVIPGLKKIKIDSNLNPTYSFESFVEGDCNKLPRSAGFAIAKKPGETAFNPFLIYGAVGLGKSHLVQAIGNRIKADHENKTVLYVTSEIFTNQFIESIQKSTVNDFIHYYQMVDVLIVEDVEFFANKGKTQDIFFVIFNHLHQSGKQLIFTCDKNPRDLEGMQERLLSRFKWGLQADVQVPDFETRLAIIEQKVYADGVEIPQNVKEYIAHHIKENVRDIESALISLLAHSTLNKQEINIELAKKIVKQFIKNSNKEISIDLIQTEVAKELSVNVALLKEKTRKREIVQARQISMYLSKKYTKKSLKQIGNFFGGRDHSTVIHSNRTVEDMMEIDDSYADIVDKLKKLIEMNMS